MIIDSPRVIWQLGDPWRDLVVEASAGACTAVTTSLATYLIDRPSGHLVRRAGATALFAEEVAWYRLDQLVSASPCGLHVVGPEPGQWIRSTPLVLLLTGIVIDWRGHSVWPSIERLAQADGADAWDLTAHPPHRCDALHCRMPHST